MATKSPTKTVKKKSSRASSIASFGAAAEEETKSGGTGHTGDNEENTSCSSLIGEIDDKDLAGVCTKWFLKCPPIGGNSHFENI